MQKKTNDIMQNMQTLNEAKLSVVNSLKLLEKCGVDGKSMQPALDDIELKLGKIDDRVKKVCASENYFVSKVENIF